MAGCSNDNDCYIVYRKLLKDVSEGGWSISSSRRWLLSLSQKPLSVSRKIYANGALVCLDAVRTAAAVSIYSAYLMNVRLRLWDDKRYRLVAITHMYQHIISNVVNSSDLH